MNKNFYLLLIFACFMLYISNAAEADIKNYPNILNFAVEKANEAAVKDDLYIRFYKVLSFSISEVQNGKQYHLFLNYLTRDGFQHYYEVVIYENPWGELNLMDLEHSSR